MSDLVVISLETWDGVWRRNQHLISRLLDADPQLRVLFVEPPADPVHDLRSGRRATFGSPLRERADVHTRLWTFRPSKLLPRRLDRRVDDRFARGVARAARRLRMIGPTLWVNDPAAAGVSRLTGWSTVYDMTDDWTEARRPERESTRISDGEQYLLGHAAQVVACSGELVRRKAPDRPDGRPPIVLIPNAVDVDFYRQPAARPADLPEGVVALYAGTLHTDRLDVDLCIDTARGLRGVATVVLVGPNALHDADTRALEAAGVVVLGARPHDRVPAYLQHADILLVPHLVNRFTDSLDPIKLYEYQAVGRPVVSTPVAGFRDAGDTCITLAEPATYAAAVAASVAPSARPPTDQEAVPDWSDRATAMAAVLTRARSAPQGREGA